MLSRRSGFGLPAVLAIAVFLIATAAILLTRDTGRFAAIWPVNAFVLVVLLNMPRRQWPGFLVAALIGIISANLVSGNGLAVSVLLSAARMVEIAIVARLIARKGHLRLTRRSGLLRLGVSAVIGCAVSTGLAQLTLLVLGEMLNLRECGVYFAAHLLGLLIFTPLLMAALNLKGGDRDDATSLAGWLALTGLVAVSAAVFTQSNFPFLFLPPAALTLVAIRSGFATSALGVLLVSIIAIVATAMGHGPITLVEGDFALRIFVLQIFLVTMTMISLTVGAAFSERRSLVERLTKARLSRRSKSVRERQLAENAKMAEQMSQVGYWTLNTDTGAVFWSPEVYRIHGVDPVGYNPALGDALAFYAEDDRQRVADLITEKSVSGEGWEVDAVIIRQSDGSRRDVRSMAACQRDHSGRVTGFFGVFKDLTAERLAVARAVEQEKRYRLLADNASDVIAVYDTKGVFSYLSPSIRELLGYLPEEMIGKTPYDFIVPDDHARLAAMFRQAAKSDAPLTVEYRAIAKDGSIRWLEARSRFQRDADGEIVEINDSVRDVTERHEREVALAEARASAESAARTKSEFLANMSHEIRTPLNGVLGFADVLADTPLNPDQTHYLDRIRTAGRGLAALIDDILDFSRIEAGAMVIEARAFDLKALVHEVVDLTRAGIGERLNVAVHYPHAVPTGLMGDEQRTRQVLLNLLGNATKFTQQGSVTLTVAVVENGIEMRVADTGIGISPQAMSQLFQEFTQADASVGRRFGGTGLGLTISRSLARLMGGDVRLESEPGVGTTATFSLPHIVGQTAAVAPHKPTAQPIRTGHRILVVDDVDSNLELIRILLSGAGHAVTEAMSGPMAIERLSGGEVFDLVLMDIQMPGMDGMEATRLIREMSGPVRDIPIVALTANVMAEQIVQCREAGMTEHLGKPVRREALFETIARVLGDRPGPDTPGPETPSSVADVIDPLADLKALYRAQMAVFSRDLAVLKTEASETRTLALSRLSHSIAGTAGSLGFGAVSDAAFALERVARGGTQSEGSADMDARTDALIQALNLAHAGDPVM